MSKDPKVRELAKKITEELFRRGRVIEGGFRGYQLLVMPKEASPIQIRECRLAFFAGAQHLFASINSILSADKEPTEADLNNMKKIFEELQAFVAEISKEKGFENDEPKQTNH